MTGLVLTAAVTPDALDPAAHTAAVDRPEAGATVSFVGVVRDHDRGRGVRSLDYEVHPSAPTVLAAVAADIAALDGVLAVAVSHRHGHLEIGDVALAAAVSAAHRGAAFAACARLVEEVKNRLPVWKRQVFDDGTDEWVGSA